MLDSTVVRRRALGCEWGGGSPGLRCSSARPNVVSSQARRAEFSPRALQVNHGKHTFRKTRPSIHAVHDTAADPCLQSVVAVAPASFVGRPAPLQVPEGLLHFPLPERPGWPVRLLRHGRRLPVRGCRCEGIRIGPTIPGGRRCCMGVGTLPPVAEGGRGVC